MFEKPVQTLAAASDYGSVLTRRVNQNIFTFDEYNTYFQHLEIQKN